MVTKVWALLNYFLITWYLILDLCPCNQTQWQWRVLYEVKQTKSKGCQQTAAASALCTTQNAYRSQTKSMEYSTH
jgi:hypothetical protein